MKQQPPKTRITLAPIEGERQTFFAKFERYGHKTERYPSPFARGQWVEKTVSTVLLVDVVDASGNPIAKQLWLNLTMEFIPLDLKGGERISFEARAKSYRTGLVSEVDEFGQTQGWKLSHPTNIRLASEP